MEKMKKYILLAVITAVAFLGIGYRLAPLVKEQGEETKTAGSDSEEEYVYLAPFKDDDMIQTQDYMALLTFAEEYGVKVTIEAPDYYNPVETAALFEKVIAREPAGIMVCATEEHLIKYINYAIEAGIPTITVDADLPQSKRLAYVGSDWYQIGQSEAEALVRLVGGKGIIASFGIVGNNNTADAWSGFTEYLREYEDITFLEMFDDISNSQEAGRLTHQLLDDYPEVAGIAAFDSNSAAGICEALEERGKIGQVKVVSVDMTEDHMELLRKGQVQLLVGQKRELFTYYGGKLLYDYNHSQMVLYQSGGDWHYNDFS